ncbi:MAG: beta-propeller domain-containing protein [Gammaproteobacteria bacterium]|nr:beta-propeller domain-containing protein [Gammaproteobacteria bacterium]
MFRTLSVISLILVVLAACMHNEDAGPSIGIRTKPQLISSTTQTFELHLRDVLNLQVTEARRSQDSSSGGFLDFLFGFGGSGTVVMEGSASAPVSDTAMSSGAHSGTNLIEQGVDEADLIKTDGSHLFVAKNMTYRYDYDVGIDTVEPSKARSVYVDSYQQQVPDLRVMALNGASAEELANITLPEGTTQIAGLFITQTDETKAATQLLVIARAVNPSPNHYYGEDTVAFAYDVSDKSAPVLQWKLLVEGSYLASRSLNGRIYLVSQRSIYLEGFEPWDTSDRGKQRTQRAIDNVKVSDVLPLIALNGEVTSLVDGNDCLIPQETSGNSAYQLSLMTILAIPYDAPETSTGLCTLESSYELYASQQALYFTIADYYNQSGSTVIHKINFTEDGLAYRASGRVDGNLSWRSSAFRINEHNDFLRMITTTHDQVRFEPEHKLYVLKENTEQQDLEIVSTLPNETQVAAIGKPGEDIYGARFFGNYAYVVTFQRTDPLYVIDLNDQTSPFISGELEVPGFSEYLHPLGDSLLLGIGHDAQTYEGRTYLQGIKVGLFDISDKTNPALLGEIKIGKNPSSTPLSYVYKAFTFLPKTDGSGYRFAFPVTVHDGVTEDANAAWHYYDWQFSALASFEVDTTDAPVLIEKGFIKNSIASDGQSWDASNISDARAAIVGDNVHYVVDGEVFSAPWGSSDPVVAQ